MSWNTNRFIRGTLEHCGSATVAELAQAGQLAESTIRAHLREMGAAVCEDRTVSPPAWSLAPRPVRSGDVLVPSGLEEAMRRSGLMARIEESRAHPERLVPLDLDQLDLDQYAEEGQMDGGVVLCVVCGDEASGQCASCDRDLCEAHLRTTAVPGDSFCLPGEGCSPKPYG